MTPADIRLLAHEVVHGPDEDCLEGTGELLRALADVQESAANLLRIEPNATGDRQVALCEVLASRVARVEALKP